MSFLSVKSGLFHNFFIFTIFFCFSLQLLPFFFKDSRARAKSASAHARSDILLAFVSLRK